MNHRSNLRPLIIELCKEKNIVATEAYPSPFR